MDMSPDSEFEDTKGNKVSSCIRSFTAVLRIRIRLDPFHFGQPDPDPLQ